MVGRIMTALRQVQGELVHLLNAATILPLCRELGYTWRQRILDPVTTIHLSILQILHGNTACSHLPHLAGHQFTASAFCQARRRLPLRIWQQVLRQVCGTLDQMTQEEGRWYGHRTFLVDGSGFSMPDTPELQAYFGYPPGQKPGCGFPVGHLLALFHAGTGFLLEVMATTGHTHDMAHVHQVHTALQPGDVLVADRGFCSFAHLALLRHQHCHAVIRVHQNQLVDFTPSRPHKVATPVRARQGVPRSRWLCHLGGLDQLVAWVKPVQRPPWMTVDQFAALPQELCVRELRYPIGQPGFRTRTVTLVTTLLAADQYPVEALAALYGRRWQVETNLRHLKQTMGCEVLHCRHLAGIMKELTVFALVYNLVRVVMLAAAKQQGVALERISFVDALRWLGDSQRPEPVPRLVVNPFRPGRVEPRAVKRRPKAYVRLTKPRSIARNALIQQSMCA